MIVRPALLQRFARRLAAPLPAARRSLHLHEYQSKALMEEFGVRVQSGSVASAPDDAGDAAQKLLDEGAREVVVKAQILAGGRGKGHFDTGFQGGVKICSTAQEAAAMAGSMLGHSLITKQTGPTGQPCEKVLVNEGISFDRELYFAILLDRSHGGAVFVVSPMGGMDIEKVAEEHPDHIHTSPIGESGVTKQQTEELARILGFQGDSIQDAQQQMERMYEMFLATDATQVEINPMVQTTDGDVFCVDAKINFDDNAAFRQKAIFEQRDFSMEDPREVEASKSDLNYIGLDGNIGCMVNGAGLAMASMDIIKLHGGDPANFLDVGGSASEAQVAEAFKILNNDPKVKAILVNIFGGIMKCDVIAEGIVAAGKIVKLDVPLVVRLEGTNVEKGKQILQQSGMQVITADDLDDAAIKAVASIRP